MKPNKLFSELILCIRGLLDDDVYLNEYRVSKHFTRTRLLSFRMMVMFLLFNSKTTLDSKLAEFRDTFPDFHFPEVSKQALSKARYGIQFELFRDLFYLSSSFYYRQTADRELWMNRYYLYAVDGSDMEVPNSDSTFREFGKQSDKKNPEQFWSMGLASIMYDVQEDIIVDAALEKQFYGERELAVRHLSRLTDLGLQNNAVVIFDRGYFSADVYQECVNSECLCLMRLRKTSHLCRLEQPDTLAEIKAPDGTQMPCRVLQVVLSSGETEYLVTNVMDEDISCKEFGELYFGRWRIETKYLELKERWNIEEFTGTGALAIRQDFYISLLHANLASIIKKGADEVISRNANKKNVYQYQARKTFIISRMRKKFVELLLRKFTQEDIDGLILDASKKRSQIQPKRTRKRKNRTRAKKHFNNKKSTI